MPHLGGRSDHSSDSLATLRTRVLAHAGAEPSPTRSQLAQRQRLLVLAAVLVPLLVFLLLGGVRASPRPTQLVVETALGAALLATVIACLALRRGSSMLGRPRVWLGAVVLLTPVVLFAWRTLASSRYPEMMTEWVTRPGLRCFALSEALAVVPLLGLLWLRRGSDPTHPQLAGAAVAAAVGAATWVLVDLWCPVSYVPHLLLGHVLPLLLLMLVGGLLGGRLLNVRRASEPRLRAVSASDPCGTARCDPE